MTNSYNKTYECDVFIAGGGTAGAAAAIAAARNGAKVILAEKSFMLGGLATAGLVTYYLPLCDGRGNQIIYGLGEELLRLSIKHGHEANYPDAWLTDSSEKKRSQQRFLVRFNPHLFTIELEQLLLSEGVKILYDSVVSGTETADGKLKSVEVVNRSGKCRILFKNAVDATGDAMLSLLAGEETEVHSKGNVLAAWYYYHSKKGYNLKQLGFADVVGSSQEKGPKPLIDRRFTGLDCDEASEMMQLSRSEILKDILKNREAQQDDTFMPVTLAVIPQLRMTRRLAGAYTQDDSESFKRFEDSIGMTGDSRHCGPVYELPYGIIHGNKIANLSACGRCVSVTDGMWDITRIIPPCVVTGQAAGTAAAVLPQFKGGDVKTVQKKLIKQGVKIHIDTLNAGLSYTK